MVKFKKTLARQNTDDAIVGRLLTRDQDVFANILTRFGSLVQGKGVKPYTPFY